MPTINQPVHTHSPVIHLLENVDGIPSVHWRLASACLVYRACTQTAYDEILLEVPRSYPLASMAKAVNKAMPHPVLVLAKGRGRDLDHVSTDGATRRAAANRAAAFPCTISDSIALSMVIGGLLQHVHPGWRPTLVPMDADTAYEDRGQPKPPNLQVPDPYLAIASGLNGFDDLIRPLVAESHTPLDGLREQTMAATILRRAQAGKRILAVYGAAHHEGICQGLASAATLPEVPAPPAIDKIEVLPLDPIDAFGEGWMDLPRLTFWFYAAFMRAAGERFDPAEALLRLIKRTIGTAKRQGAAASIRALESMLSYCIGGTAAAGRALPEFAELLHAAESCAGGRFADMLVRTALSYPRRQDGDYATVKKLPDGKILINYQGKSYLATSRQPVDDDLSAQRRTYVRRAGQLSSDERGAIAGLRKGSFQPAPNEQERLTRYNQQVRALAARQPKMFAEALPLSGSYLGLGVDVRRTVRAWMRGDGRLFVRHPRYQPAVPASDDRAPVVWILDPAAKIATHQAGHLPSRQHGRVYASFYWFSGRAVVRGSAGGVVRSQSGYFTSLLREYADPYTEEHIGRLISSIPPHRRCRVEPWLDQELQRFNRYEQAVAVAIKYAGSHVVVVADPSVEFSQELAAYSQQRGVRISRLPIRSFDPTEVARLAIDHEVAAPSLYEAPYAALLRFVDPV